MQHPLFLSHIDELHIDPKILAPDQLDHGLQVVFFRAGDPDLVVLLLGGVVCQQSPYRDIAAFQHIWLQKGDKNDSLLCK